MTWYYCWIVEKTDRRGAKGKIFNVVRMIRKRVICSIETLIKQFHSSLPQFFSHYFTTTHQFKTLRSLKENLQENEVYLIIDFSQNYVCKYNEEVHGAHFGASKKQVSLHTGGFYWKNQSGKLSVKTFASASENLRHDAASVWAHLQPVWNFIKTLVPDVTVLNFQSDGPSTQYKNKTNFFLLQHFAEKWGLENVTWNFTSAGHGKSIADAAGANIKGLCDRAVTHGQNILGAEDLVTLVNRQDLKITAFLMQENALEQIDLLIPDNLKPVPGTANVHQVICAKSHNKRLFFRSLSCHECSRQVNCLHHGMSKSNMDYSDHGKDAIVQRKRKINA